MIWAAFVIALTGHAWGAGIDFEKLPWGQPKAGLQISLQSRGTVAGSKFALLVFMRNIATGEVDLPPAPAKKADVFGWVIVQQGGRKYFSGRIDIGNDVQAWPKKLTGDKAISVINRDLLSLNLYRYKRGVKFITAWREGKKLKQPAAGAIRDVIKTGPLTAMFCMYLKLPGGREMLLKSGALQVTVAPPDFSKLDAGTKKTFTANLLAQFDKDPWSGQAACRTAVKIGKPLAAALIEAAFQVKRPGHSRMWITTAVCGIRDDRCPPALIKLLQDPVVRTIVAYHGPRQKSGKLDAAITARAKELKASRFTAYALLGFMAFRNTAPPELLSLGLDSKDPRTRAAAAEVLRKVGGGHSTIDALLKLLRDDEPRVRATAGRVLGYIGNRSRRVIGAMVAAMELPGDVARKRIAVALCLLTGQDIPYPATGPAAEKQKAVQKWKIWWQKQNQKQKPPSK